MEFCLFVKLPDFRGLNMTGVTELCCVSRPASEAAVGEQLLQTIRKTAEPRFGEAWPQDQFFQELNWGTVLGFVLFCFLVVHLFKLHRIL